MYRLAYVELTVTISEITTKNIKFLTTWVIKNDGN